MRRRMLLLASTLFGTLAGCGEKPTPDYMAWETGDPGETGETGDPETYSDYTGWAYYDVDEDGFYNDEDCDDDDPAINPDADEVCDDEVDNDCDGLIDAADDDCV